MSDVEFETKAEDTHSQRYEVPVGQTFTAPSDGAYSINGVIHNLKAGEVFTVKPCVPFPVGQVYMMRGQEFKVAEVGDRALFMKRAKSKIALGPKDPAPVHFIIGSQMRIGGLDFVMIHYFEPKDVYAFMPKEMWLALKEKNKDGKLG